MSAAGTPSTDPWVILARERARYEEQFKSLKPVNGVITGDQAKGFFLQSQLPPIVLGRIWALADTDADGKMNINEFSIACKLINLKLRGFEVPSGLPPSLLASLKTSTPPAIPPLPNPNLITQAPARPEPPKPVPLASTQPLIQTAPILSNMPISNQPLVSGIGGVSVAPPPASGIGGVSMAPPPASGIGGVSMAPPPASGIGGASVTPPSTAISMSVAPPTSMMGMTVTPGVVPSNNLMGSTVPVGTVPPNTMGMMGGIMPPISGGIPTGVVSPMPSSMPNIQQPLISGVPLMSATSAPNMSRPLVGQPNGFGTTMVPNQGSTAAPLVTTMPPLISGTPSTSATLAGAALNGSSIRGPPVTPLVATTASAVSSPPVTSVVPGPGATSTPRASITSLERTGSAESASQVEWAVPHQTKLKYTQIFNTTDRARTGYLSGAQARNVMVQTKLPQNLLAQIWALSDMDADGRLGCEEFVLAMHLCEQAALGNLPPAKLPPELVPPSFRRTTRTASISSQGSVAADQDPASMLLQSSFEDKRKENYEKGQAELERRRKTLLDQQRKEAEERERKEREEQERKEKARQEAERKRIEELERQMREQQEKERLIEEERKKQAEQREAARKEMERQRQLEWEKQRLQELQQQRQREQENVLKLKAKNQSLTIELSTLNNQVKELSQKICDTRVAVSNVKSTIDGMRSTRDAQMQEMSQLKNKLKEQNARLLALSQEKAKLEAKNKLNAQDSEQARLAFENKEVTIKNLKEKIADMQTEIDGKLKDIDNNNSQLSELQSQMSDLVKQCESLYSVYEEKRDKVLEMKNKPVNYENAWKTESAWGDDNTTTADWPTDNWGTSTSPLNLDNIPGVHKYRAIYEFQARNNDEISFQPGDIINVPEQQTGEPGWLAGEIGGHTGWFPESYVEPVDGIGIKGASEATTDVFTAQSAVETETLKGISEIPEETSEEQQPTEPLAATVVQPELGGEPEYYIASYPYQSQEPGDLTFNAGEVIAVYKKEGDWWTGKLGDAVGIFPSNYVQKVDVTAPTAATNEPEAAPTAAVSYGVSAEAVTSALESVNANAQFDNEVSEITQNKPTVQETKSESRSQSTTQVTKSKKPEIASVIAPYQATSPEQLSLARGQLIMIRKKTDSGWWEGELQAKGRKRQVGWFPASYVKVLNSSGRISGRTTPVSTTRMQQEVIIDKVIALYPYTAANPDELSFAKDDIISVTAREEEAWWRGELNGVSGLFPSNYVAPLQQQ